MSTTVIPFIFPCVAAGFPMHLTGTEQRFGNAAGLLDHHKARQLVNNQCDQVLQQLPVSSKGRGHDRQATQSKHHDKALQSQGHDIRQKVIAHRPPLITAKGGHGQGRYACIDDHLHEPEIDDDAGADIDRQQKDKEYQKQDKIDRQISHVQSAYKRAYIVIVRILI